jgi:hypothetical protein
MSNLASEVYAMATKKGTRITVDAWGGFAILPAEIEKEKGEECEEVKDEEV